MVKGPGLFPFCRKKSKKSHKMGDVSVKSKESMSLIFHISNL
ncbi:hypothetical protein YYC_04815 [Plasmodium yoelii 17X]|uniref:Uncharacterized protein n=1 Tax=Plasmodium yoelii 17X TaxID=1323249 RepID=V7PEX7_PLAYE|nr:hypothetical protein YYC_04815 [Plasmodium yoelii 17X]